MHLTADNEKHLSRTKWIFMRRYLLDNTYLSATKVKAPISFYGSGKSILKYTSVDFCIHYTVSCITKGEASREISL